MTQTLVLMAIGLTLTVVGLTLLSGGSDSLAARVLQRAMAAVPQRSGPRGARTAARGGRKHRSPKVQEKAGWLLVAGGAIIAAIGLFG